MSLACGVAVMGKERGVCVEEDPEEGDEEDEGPEAGGRRGSGEAQASVEARSVRATAVAIVAILTRV